MDRRQFLFIPLIAAVPVGGMSHVIGRFPAKPTGRVVQSVDFYESNWGETSFAEAQLIVPKQNP